MGTILLWFQMSRMYSKVALITGPRMIAVWESFPAGVQGFGMETMALNDMALVFRTKQFRRYSFHWAVQTPSIFHIISLKSGTWLAQKMSKHSRCKPVLPICAFISILPSMTIIFQAVCMPKWEGALRRKIESCATTYRDSHHNFIRWP